RDAARHDLARLRDVGLQRRQILVVDLFHALRCEAAELLAPKIASHDVLSLLGFGCVVERRYGAIEVGRRSRPLARRRATRRRLSLALLFFFARLRHERRFRNRFIARDDEMTQHGVAEPECADELVERGLVALDVQQQVVGLVNFGDRVRELAASPVLLTVDLAAGAFDHVAVPLIHGRYLFALVRMDQKHDFVVSQTDLPMGLTASRNAVRQGAPRLFGSGARDLTRSARGAQAGNRPWAPGATARTARCPWRPRRSGSRPSPPSGYARARRRGRA